MLEKHNQTHNIKNAKIKIAIFHLLEFPTQHLNNMINQKFENMKIDFILDDDKVPKEDYDIVIDLNFTNYDSLRKKAKFLNRYDMNSQKNYYYGFIPNHNIEEVQKIRAREQLPIEICNFLNNDDQKIKKFKEEKNEFDIYENISNKLNKESKYQIPDRSLLNLYRLFKTENETIENIIIDYLYFNQNEVFDNNNKSYSLLSGKEGYISLIIYLDKNLDLDKNLIK